MLIFDYDADLDAYIITIDRDGNSIKFVLYVNAERTVKLLPKVDDPHHGDRLYNISNRYIVYKDRHVTHDRCIAMKIMAVSNKPFKGDLFISRIISEYKHKTAEINQCERHINELKIQRAKILAAIRLNKMVKPFVKSFVGEKDHPVN